MLCGRGHCRTGFTSSTPEEVRHATVLLDSVGAAHGMGKKSERQFCPMDCGDVNGDGFVNSTDALIILSYELGIDVPFPVGQPGCPGGVAPCPGCGS